MLYGQKLSDDMNFGDWVFVPRYVNDQITLESNNWKTGYKTTATLVFNAKALGDQDRIAVAFTHPDKTPITEALEAYIKLLLVELYKMRMNRSDNG